MPETAWIGIGANLGDPMTTLRDAVRELGCLPHTQLDAVSQPWQSAAIGADGPRFVNAVARLSTALGPHALLDALLAIEARHGRKRTARNAPRTLDLDLLLLGNRRLDDDRLALPHPRLHQRRFVLGPLLELDPLLEIPGLGPARDWLARVAAQDADPIPDACLWP